MNETDVVHPAQPFDIIGAAAFAQAFTELLATQPHELWLCAERFDDWPLEQPHLMSALLAWSKARTQGHVYILAREFTWVQRSAARFMEWRRLFAHQVQAKRWPQRLPDELKIPRGIFSSRAAIELGFHPAGQLIARHNSLPGPIATQLQALLELWDKSSAALPAHTLGL